jgi:hypothetical protein
MVLEGELPPIARELGSQGVELFGHTEALHFIAFELTFSQHVYQLDAGEGRLRNLKRFEPKHRTCHSLHTLVILLKRCY